MLFINNLPGLLIYSITFYVLLIPLNWFLISQISFDFWIPSISIALILGFICTFINAKFKTNGDERGNFQ